MIRHAVLAFSLLIALAAVSLAEDKPKAGTLSGRVRVTGTIPRLAPVAGAVAACGGVAIADETLVVNEKEENGLANVVIWMKAAPVGHIGEDAEGSVVLELTNCRFQPHVQAVRVNQKIEVHNKDAAAYNVQTMPVRSQETNVLVAGGSNTTTYAYNQAERVPVQVKSNVYPWMRAWQIVTDHPFVAVSDTKGKFEIKDIPPGTHEFVVWHEGRGYLVKAKAIEFKAGETTTLDLEFDAQTLLGRK